MYPIAFLIALVSVAAAAPTIIPYPTSSDSTLVKASPLGGPLANAEGFYLSSTVDNVGGIGIVKGVKNAVSVKFILSSYYARGAIWEIKSTDPQSAEFPYLVLDSERTLRFGSHVPYTYRPTEAPTPYGNRSIESAIWYTSQTNLLQAQFVNEAGVTEYLGACYSWTNDANPVNHLKFVTANYESPHLCGQNYYALTIENPDSLS